MESAYARTNNICLLLLTAIGITVALIYTKTVMVPFVIALFCFAVISPVVRWLTLKWKLPHGLAVTAAFFGVLLISVVLLFFVSGSIQEFLTGADVYRDKLIALVQWAENVATQWGYDLEAANIREYLRTLPIFQWAQNVTGGVFSFFGTASLVILFLLFLIAGGGSDTSSRLMDEVNAKISRYAATKVMTSLTTGVLVWIVLVACGVELAFMFFVLTVLLNFIPNFGSVIATVVPLPVVILQYGFGWQFWVVLALSGVIQFGIGNIVEPKMMGDSLGLHPISILIFLMFWGLIWGLPGMFMAVPITAVIQIVLYRIEATRPFAELLGGHLPK